MKETCKINEQKISYFIADITKEEDVKKLIEHIKAKFGKLDILVNNAGLSFMKPIKENKLKDFDTVFNLNVRALFNITIEVLPLIIKSKGNIINISSVMSTHLTRGYSLYSCSKSAVNIFTRSWAIELANEGVRVNAIAPGPIDTELWTKNDLPLEQSLIIK